MEICQDDLRERLQETDIMIRCETSRFNLLCEPEEIENSIYNLRDLEFRRAGLTNQLKTAKLHSINRERAI